MMTVSAFSFVDHDWTFPGVLYYILLTAKLVICAKPILGYKSSMRRIGFLIRVHSWAQFDRLTATVRSPGFNIREPKLADYKVSDAWRLEL